MYTKYMQYIKHSQLQQQISSINGNQEHAHRYFTCQFTIIK